MAVCLLRSGDWSAAWHIGRSAALPANHRCAVGLLPLPREEFRQLKLILHSELRRRAASRRALPCPSSVLVLKSTFPCLDSAGNDLFNQVIYQYV